MITPTLAVEMEVFLSARMATWCPTPASPPAPEVRAPPPARMDPGSAALMEASSRDRRSAMTGADQAVQTEQLLSVLATLHWTSHPSLPALGADRGVQMEDRLPVLMELHFLS